jgi:hypothetical protein
MATVTAELEAHARGLLERLTAAERLRLLAGDLDLYRDMLDTADGSPPPTRTALGSPTVVQAGADARAPDGRASPSFWQPSASVALCPLLLWKQRVDGKVEAPFGYAEVLENLAPELPQVRGQAFPLLGVQCGEDPLVRLAVE